LIDKNAVQAPNLIYKLKSTIATHALLVIMYSDSQIAHNWILFPRGSYKEVLKCVKPILVKIHPQTEHNQLPLTHETITILHGGIVVQTAGLLAIRFGSTMFLIQGGSLIC